MVCREGEGKVKYTRKGTDVYAVFCDRPEKTERLHMIKSAMQAQILGTDILLPISNEKNGISLDFSDISLAHLPKSMIFAVRLTEAKV